MKYRSIYLFGLVVLLLSIMACSILGGGPGEDTVSIDEPTPGGGEGGTDEVVESSNEGMPITGNGLCANAYYPVREGATWTYSNTSTVAEEFQQSDTLTSVRDDSFTMTSQINELTRTQEWECGSEGLVAITVGGGPAGSLSTTNMNLVLETQNVSGVTYPVEIGQGDQWSHSLDFFGTMDIAGQSAEANGNELSNYTALGMEIVTVPAGTFDAMKIQVELTLNINATFQGATVPVTFTASTTTWLVQGVGWVKSISSGNFAGEAYTETIELMSYSIP